jgi:putative ABC transport system ATP-binding protein
MGSRSPSLVGVRLTRTFGTGTGRTVALRAVTLECHPGEFTLIMGPSGCGKTTLLATLSGLLRPDDGQVLALGEDLWRLSEARRREFRLRHFGFVFQGYNLFPTLTAREQLEMVARWGEGLSRRDARHRVGEVLEVLGLPRKADLLPAELSGGEKQRVAIGRALLKRPAVCFADEPTSALDWGTGEPVIELLHRAAHQDGATILVVAHDPRLLPYADQVLHLQDGSVIEPGPEPAPPRRTPDPGHVSASVS